MPAWPFFLRYSQISNKKDILLFHNENLSKKQICLYVSFYWNVDVMNLIFQGHWWPGAVHLFHLFYDFRFLSSLSNPRHVMTPQVAGVLFIFLWLIVSQLATKLSYRRRLDKVINMMAI